MSFKRLTTSSAQASAHTVPSTPRRPGRAWPISLLASLITLPLIATSVLAADAVTEDDPKARAIMQRVDERDQGDNQTSKIQMVLIDKRGNQRVRELQNFTKDQGEDTYSMLFFLSPADVKDTGFLTFDYDKADQDDDQWLYLPALKKTKRIASSDKSGSFMGSDFSYTDMTDRPIENYRYKILKEAEVKGHPVWVIESTPATEDELEQTGYTRSVLFIRKDIDVVVRSKIWVKKGKRNKYLEVQELEQIDGIWVPTVMTMTTKKGKQTLHKTVMRTSDVQFNQDLKIDDFSERGLETGP